MKKIALAAILSLSCLTVPVFAEAIVYTDAIVNGLNPVVYNALLRIRQATGNSGVLHAQAAQFLGQAMLADQHIDPIETELLVELTQDKARLVRIYPANRQADALILGTTSGAARQVLRELLLPQKTLDHLLTAGADGWTQLARLSERSPADAKQVQGYLQKYLTLVWGNSTLSNRYEPIRGFIKQADIDLKTLPAADHKQAQLVLYQALVQTDAQVKGNIPDFFYSWLK